MAYHAAMLMTRFPFFVILILSLAASTTVRGDNSQMDAWLKFLGQHGYGAVKASLDENSEQFLAKINHRAVYLVIDTGCGESCLTTEASKYLKLDVHDSKYDSWGAGGKIEGVWGRALIASFTLNDFEINRTNLIHVLPRASTMGRTDGYFGLDLMRYNSVILPVGAKGFFFHPGNQSIPSIENYMTAMGYQSVPLHYTEHELFIDGELNGKPCRALIDSGCSYSTFDLDYVLKTQGGYVTANRIQEEGLDRTQMNAYEFVPSHLRLGAVVLDKTVLTAAKTPSFAHYGFNALFGYDLLAAHNAILDLGHNQLWIK